MNTSESSAKNAAGKMTSHVPIRVLHVSGSISARRDADAPSLRHLLVSQQAIGIEVRIAANFHGDEDAAVAEEFRKLGIPVLLVGQEQSGNSKVSANLKHAMGGEISRADMVHIHGVDDDIQVQAAQAAMRLQVPYIVSAHGMIDSGALKRSSFLKKISGSGRLNTMLHDAVVIHCTSDAESGMIHQRDPSLSCIVIPDAKSSDSAQDSLQQSPIARLWDAEYRRHLPWSLSSNSS